MHVARACLLNQAPLRIMTTAGETLLLDVKELSMSFKTSAGWLPVTRDISFSIKPGERVGLVGESGCGKTVTGLSIMKLLPLDTTCLTGEIWFQGRNLQVLPEREMRLVRGRDIGMIFQEPMSALDPVFTVGHQIAEAYTSHFTCSRAEARERALSALESVGIPLPSRRCDEFPHQLSGGMRQRVMIALALICKPKLLIADEPTTALDVTVQAQIIELLCDLSEKSGTALLFVTHDLGVVAETCNRILTMYAGEIVEDGPVDSALATPLHPYTSGLLRSLPRLTERRARLSSIPGRVPPAGLMPSGCRFSPRCNYMAAGCEQEQILTVVADDLPRKVRCHRYDELNLPGAIQ